MAWYDWLEIGFLTLFVAGIGGATLGGYKLVWTATTGEPFTFIVRRFYEGNKFLIWGLLLAGVGGISFLQWVLAELHGVTLILVYSASVFLFGHFFWCGYRPGRLHPDTAYRILDNLREYQRTHPADNLVDYMENVLQQERVQRPEDYRLPPLRVRLRRPLARH